MPPGSRMLIGCLVALALFATTMTDSRTLRATENHTQDPLTEICRLNWPTEDGLLGLCLFKQRRSLPIFKQYRVAATADSDLKRILDKCHDYFTDEQDSRLVDWQMTVFCVKREMKIVENFRKLAQLDPTFQGEEEFERNDCKRTYPNNKFDQWSCYEAAGKSAAAIPELIKMTSQDPCMTDIVPKCIDKRITTQGDHRSWVLARGCILDKIEYVKKVRTAGELQILDHKTLKDCR